MQYLKVESTITKETSEESEVAFKKMPRQRRKEVRRVDDFDMSDTGLGVGVLFHTTYRSYVGSERR